MKIILSTDRSDSDKCDAVLSSPEMQTILNYLHGQGKDIEAHRLSLDSGINFNNMIITSLRDHQFMRAFYFLVLKLDLHGGGLDPEPSDIP